MSDQNCSNHREVHGPNVCVCVCVCVFVCLYVCVRVCVCLRLAQLCGKSFCAPDGSSRNGTTIFQPFLSTIGQIKMTLIPDQGHRSKLCLKHYSEGDLSQRQLSGLYISRNNPFEILLPRTSRCFKMWKQSMESSCNSMNKCHGRSMHILKAHFVLGRFEIAFTWSTASSSCWVKADS